MVSIVKDLAAAASEEKDTRLFLEELKNRVLVFDGAMGTNLFEYNLEADDYGGEAYEGCPEQLNFTRPEIIQEIHEKFLNAGADIIETNTFGAAKHVLAEYGLEEKSYEVSYKAALIAKSAIKASGKKAYVAGALGPGTKLITLGHINYDDLYNSYKDSFRGLIDAGVDLILLETCQDPLQIKACLNSCLDVFKEKGIPKLPIQVQVTVEQTGTLLVGSDIGAALSTISNYPIDVFGLNCATGPKEMQAHLQYLSENSPFFISCLPNAGIPENRCGHAHFPLNAEEFSESLSKFVKNYGINIVGGCCGTSYKHIKNLSEAVKEIKPFKRKLEQDIHETVSSLYNSVSMIMDPKPLIVGERTNANGSKLFRELLAKEDYEAMVEIAKEQLEEGAHVLDLCAAYVGRDEAKDMKELSFRINTAVNIPIMVDSTELDVLEVSLKQISSKAIINSVNLEDGETRVEQVADLCKKFGSALVVLTIDEEGMAKNATKKFEVAKRLYKLLVNKHGINPKDLIFDTLTFTLGSGDEEMRKAGIETIEAIRLIKKEFPEVKTILGVSNISFGLNPKIRPILNSVFLFEAIQAGLDMAIVNNKKIIPLNKIEKELLEVAKDLIWDKRKFKEEELTYDPLIRLMELSEEVKVIEEKNSNPYEGLEIEEILSKRIIDGNKTNIDKDLDLALNKGYKALEIINEFLMAGMKIVGEKFASGEMQLPFVLQSATTMKAAVAYLEKFMEKSDQSQSKGSIVLATVKGDVHDIGKNLVDIILSNNGYKVYNLGIKIPIEEIIKSVEEYNPDVIGLSGLLVKSTLIMKQNLEILNERNCKIPVILGGAALTRRYVEEDCAQAYKGTVFYGFDAFTDLSLMEKICTGVDLEKVKEEFYKTKPRNFAEESVYQEVQEANKSDERLGSLINYTEKLSDTRILDSENIPKAPFHGSKIVKSEDIDLEELWFYLNFDAMAIGQWRLGKEKEKIGRPVLKRLKEEIKKNPWLKPKIVYGYFSCRVGDSNPNLLEILDEKNNLICDFKFPRQDSKENLCLSDYFRTKNKSNNLVAFQIVTIGQEAADYVQGLYKAGEFSEYLYNYGLAVESTEALAEYNHAKIRKELGFESEDPNDIKDLLRCAYHGMRYSFGYPACPRLEDHAQLFKLLNPEKIGIEISDEWQLNPEHSTSAIIVHHPDAKYFNVK